MASDPSPPKTMAATCNTALRICAQGASNVSRRNAPAAIKAIAISARLAYACQTHFPERPLRMHEDYFIRLADGLFSEK
jgi:hypothetical protein